MASALAGGMARVHPRERAPRPVTRHSGNSLALLARQTQAIDGPLPCLREHPHLWFSDRRPTWS
jgi:hypothetical protein